LRYPRLANVLHQRLNDYNRHTKGNPIAVVEMSEEQTLCPLLLSVYVGNVLYPT
jgi:hypothetical protein